MRGQWGYQGEVCLVFCITGGGILQQSIPYFMVFVRATPVDIEFFFVGGECC